MKTLSEHRLRNFLSILALIAIPLFIGNSLLKEGIVPKFVVNAVQEYQNTADTTIKSYESALVTSVSSDVTHPLNSKLTYIDNLTK